MHAGAETGITGVLKLPEGQRIKRTKNSADGALDMNMKPTAEVSGRGTFGIDTDMVVKGVPDRTDRVPAIDSTYKFDPDTTLAILAGFMHNRRVMIQGYDCLLYKSDASDAPLFADLGCCRLL